MFQYRGVIPSSKSIYNRALIVQSYYPQLLIEGESHARDVVYLKKALQNLNSTNFDAGEGGTTFRFLVLRLSRQVGQFKIYAKSNLLKRPQGPLLQVLEQLGVQVSCASDHWLVQSNGWKNPQRPLKVSVAESSQFLSAVLLNAWDLAFDMEIECVGEMLSEPYFQMTLEMVQELGLIVNKEKNKFFISSQQRVKKNLYTCEIDLSSAFSLAACAVLDGDLILENFPNHSLQADFQFLSAFDLMGIRYILQDNQLRISQQKIQSGLDLNLRNCPDLFPVLSCLCSLAPGKSRLYGAPHLKFKESDRIQAVADLLRGIDGHFIEKEDGLEIVGPTKIKSQKISFHPHQDHRMAMAAQVLVSAGFPIQILEPECVNKSFPEFWEIVGSK